MDHHHHHHHHQNSGGGGGGGVNGNRATRFLHTLTGWLHGAAGSYGAVDGGDDEDDSPGCCSGVKGFVPVYVGTKGEQEEELQRFMVKLKHLEHPLFRKLLELREEELGFCDSCDHGKLVIPCDASLFQSVLWHIESCSNNHSCTSPQDVDRLLGSLTSTCVQKHHPD